MRTPEFYELLSLRGELLEGVSANDASTLSDLGLRSAKPHCVVYSWIVLDVEGEEHEPNTKLGSRSENLVGRDSCAFSSAEPRLPLVLFAHYVEFHSAGRFEKGVSIRSSQAIAYDGRGIFETGDTIYILLGKGFRRPASARLIYQLPEGFIHVDYSQPYEAPKVIGLAALIEQSPVVYCDIQMTHAEGRELLALVESLRASGLHVGLERVFSHIEQDVLCSLSQTSITTSD